MDDELVTAATFGDHTQAVVVRTVLEEAGIPAFLVGEWMSQGLFVIGNPSGGVRLQVPASRLQEAMPLIQRHSSEDGAPLDWSQVDVGEPEAEAAADEEPPPEPTPTPPPPAAAPVEETEPTDLTLRERRANRIVLGALIGLLCWPVLILAFWRMVQIANSKERLRPEYQRKANIGATIIALATVWVLFWSCLVSVYWSYVFGAY